MATGLEVFPGSRTILPSSDSRSLDAQELFVAPLWRRRCRCPSAPVRAPGAVRVGSQRPGRRPVTLSPASARRGARELRFAGRRRCCRPARQAATRGKCARPARPRAPGRGTPRGGRPGGSGRCQRACQRASASPTISTNPPPSPRLRPEGLPFCVDFVTSCKYRERM